MTEEGWLTTAAALGPLRGPPLNRSVNATGLRTALRRCDLGAELQHLADTCLMPWQANHNLNRLITELKSRHLHNHR